MIILVANEKGGVAKTSIAVNLAARFVADGMKTLLLDTDTKGSRSTSDWLTTRETHDVPLIETFCLTATPARMVAEQATKYDVVIVDAGAAAHDTMFSVSRQADVVLVPCAPGQYEVGSTLRVFSEFRALDSRHIRGVVPAMVVLANVPNHPRSKEVADVRAFLIENDVPVLDSVLRSRKAWRESSKEGLAVFELPASLADVKAQEELEALYQEVYGLLEEAAQ
jgi:chromosome partitioning protein